MEEKIQENHKTIGPTSSISLFSRNKQNQSLDSTQSATYDCKSQNVPGFINILMNIITTFALSLAVYLLITNIFLFVQNINIQPHIRSSFKQKENTDRNNFNDFAVHECHQLNRYRQNYYKLKREQNLGDDEPLRVNTTYFMF
jgi:hypothetical protein